LEHTEKRLSRRIKYENISCVITLNGFSEAIISSIADASVFGAFLRIYSKKIDELSKIDLRNNKGSLVIEDVKVPFGVIRTGDLENTNDTWIAITFYEAKEELIQCLDSLSTDQRTYSEDRI
jgi:hypothetical protein